MGDTLPDVDGLEGKAMNWFSLLLTRGSGLVWTAMVALALTRENFVASGMMAPAVTGTIILGAASVFSLGLGWKMLRKSKRRVDKSHRRLIEKVDACVAAMFKEDPKYVELRKAVDALADHVGTMSVTAHYHAASPGGSMNDDGLTGGENGIA